MGTMASFYKSQVSAFAKDSETAAWGANVFLVIAYMKRSGHTLKKKCYFANIKINVHSTREKDDKVVLDKRIKRFNFVAYK